MRTAVVCSLVVFLVPTAAHAARPIAGGHYVVHITPRPPADEPQATVLHVLRRGDEFTEVSWLLASDRSCSSGDGGFGPVYLHRTGTEPPLKISRWGFFGATRRDEGVDARGRPVTSTLTISGRFVTRRLATGWYSHVDGPYADGSVCWTGPVAFRAQWSRSAWRSVPKWDDLPASRTS